MGTKKQSIHPTNTSNIQRSINISFLQVTTNMIVNFRFKQKYTGNKLQKRTRIELEQN